jgi:hypothetical protein
VFCSAIAAPGQADDDFLAFPMVTDDEASVDDDDSVGPHPELASDDDPNDNFLLRPHPDLPDDLVTNNSNSLHFQTKVTNWHREGKKLQDIKPDQVLPEPEYAEHNTPQADLLAWHYRLGHLSFDRIYKLAERGDLPGHLKKAKQPKCAACMYGKAHRRQWRTKAPLNQSRIPPVKRPGDVVGIDQLISPTPGFVAQMRGILTSKRYTATTVFVDHHSGLSFVHCQLSTSAVHTIEAKRAFERYAKTYDVKIKHYHADNGIFDSKAFVREVHNCGQGITYCAVNAHHQNGKAEKKIRDLQDAARTMLLHAKQRWPNAVTTHLWPYAI